MAEYKNLVELVCESLAVDCGGDCAYPNKSYCSKCYRVAEYFIENGVILPPCKVGDTVYVIPTVENGMSCIEEREISYILVGADNEASYCSYDPLYKRKGYKSKEYAMSERMFGKSVFFSKEDAVKALAEGRGDK